MKDEIKDYERIGRFTIFYYKDFAVVNPPFFHYVSSMNKVLNYMYNKGYKFKLKYAGALYFIKEEGE